MQNDKTQLGVQDWTKVVDERDGQCGLNLAVDAPVKDARMHLRVGERR